MFLHWQMLFTRLRQKAPFFVSLAISCFILGVYSEALASFRFAGGSYGLGYRSYKETENGNLLGKADSLSQRLNFTAINRGNFYGQRSSPYSLLLGYYHERHSTDIEGSSYSPSSNDLYWDGNAALQQTRKGGMSVYAMAKKRERSLFGPIGSGKRIAVDFAAQVKKEIFSEHGISVINGNKRTLKSYLSYYRSSRGYENDPYADYEEQYSHLSLQRGINWLHIDHEEDQPSNSETTSFRLGNISHGADGNYVPSSFRRGTREWFRLTNWFEISTDLEYQVVKENASYKSSEYGVSFFGKGYRRDWSTFVSPSYSAIKDNTSDLRELRLPARFNYFPSRKFEISSFTFYSKNETINNLGSKLSWSENISEELEARIEPQTWLVIRPNYNIEMIDDTGLKRLDQDGGIEVLTTGADINTTFESSLRTLKQETITGIDYKSDILNIKAGVIYKRFAWVRNVAFSQAYARSTNNSGDKSESNVSQFGVQVTPPNRFRGMFRAIHRDTDTNGKTSKVSEVDAGLNYDSRRRFANDFSIYMKKEEGFIGDSKLTTLDNTATYRFSEKLGSETIIKLDKTNDVSGTGKVLSFSEVIQYTQYTGGFFGRKKFEVYGSYIFGKSNSSAGQDRTESEYATAVAYYVTNAFTIGGSYLYKTTSLSNTNTETQIYANYQFPKLRARIIYNSDVAEMSDIGKKTTEKITFSLTKYF